MGARFRSQHTPRDHGASLPDTCPVHADRDTAMDVPIDPALTGGHVGASRAAAVGCHRHSVHRRGAPVRACDAHDPVHRPGVGDDLEHLADGQGADVEVGRHRGPRDAAVEILNVDGTVAHGFRPFLLVVQPDTEL